MHQEPQSLNFKAWKVLAFDDLHEGQTKVGSLQPEFTSKQSEITMQPRSSTLWQNLPVNVNLKVGHQTTYPSETATKDNLLKYPFWNCLYSKDAIN